MANVDRSNANAAKVLGHPQAGPIMVRTYAQLNTLAEMLAVKADKEKSMEMVKRLCQDFSDNELMESGPEMIIALCGCLRQALLVLGSTMVKD